MCATYRDKQKRSHFESFANKIYTGIREIKPEYAEKRAIWELFQNALDTVEQNGVIEIAITEKGLLFKHNGRPFKDDEFGGLIKQFSVGKTYGDNKDKLGQYGTGFISTHVYGKTIFINGSIKTDDGSYRILNNFKLDRDAKDIDELTDKLLDQDHLIEILCDNAETPEVQPLPFTSFEYYANESNRAHIIGMFKYVESILPYIFCFNDKLSEVRLLNGNSVQEYIRTKPSNGMVYISKNGKPLNYDFIHDAENGVKIILGTEDRTLNDIPKLFLFYPLMDTSGTGYNFIIHANDFKPNKERDYLHKESLSPELKTDVDTNDKLLEVAFNLVLQKIVDEESISFMDIVKMEFTGLDSDFEKDLKRKYINSIKDLDRLYFDDEKHSLSSLQFFDDSILLLDDETKKSTYSLLKQFCTLPPFYEYCELSKYVNNWNSNISDKFSLLTLTGVAEIVTEESGGNYYYIQDKVSFQKFICQIGQDISLLNRLELIPNIHGDFRHFENLVKWDLNEPLLINVVDNIDALISEKYIHLDFEFLENLNSYTRENFKDDFSKFCNDEIDKISKEKEGFTIGDTRFTMLVEFLKNFIGLNKKTPLNIDIDAFYERVFQLPTQSNELSDPTVNTNYQPAIKLLANLYIKKLTVSKISENISDLKEIVSIMFRNTNLKEELLHKLACLPNQNFILKSQAYLKRDDVKDEEFKSEYDIITNKNESSDNGVLANSKIRNELVYDGFEVFLQHTGSVNGLQLGEAIETSLNKDKKFIPVVNNTLNTVLKLIEKISEKSGTWGQWLPNINRVKEEILMHKFQNERTRSSLFSILTKNEKTIELLGSLAAIENLEELVKKGKERQQEETRQANHLGYITYIGLTIQDLIQKQLGIELANVVSVLKSEDDNELTTQEEQNGQDFIIYKNRKPIYFIEVKSKWDENGRFALTKNQTEKCAAKKNQYGVVSVNVDRYKRKYAIDIENISFEDLKEFVKVNDNLGKDFEKLVNENVSKNELNDPKLIEYRGSIPQKLIDEEGKEFDSFMQELIQKIKIA